MIDLDAIKTRLAAAIPAPWYVDDSLRGVEAQAYGYPVEVVAWTGRAEAVLIAHAPADLTVLVAEVERLREMLLNAGWPREAEELAALALRYERAAVVAWLRAEAVAFAGTRTEQGVQRAKSLALAADNIERGEHRREENE